MNLSTIDRLVRKLEPVDALVEKLCERLLPHEVVHAAGAGCVPGTYRCLYDYGCGVITGSPHVYCCELGDGSLDCLHCGC